MPSSRRTRGNNEERRRSRSRSPKRERKADRKNSHKKDQHQDHRPEDGKNHRIVWGNVGVEEEYEQAKRKEKGEDVPEEEKEKANFGLTGALAKDEITGNIYNGVLLKWTEPLDAAPPPRGWRIYVFKGDEIVETLYLHRQSAYLFGREGRVADHVLAHPSCSSQHAVIQFRATTAGAASSENFDEQSRRRQVRPYLMDLASTNKTTLNSIPIDDSRYYELRPKDVIKFGNSTREYVVIHEREEGAGAAK
jgi:smad nuclear-interacting protein 1